jgi:hypothetical protein
MKNIIEFWDENPDLFKSKSLSQILTFIGEGKLLDNSDTSKEFRQLLDIVPTEILKGYVNDCLTDKFENSGFALQDIINQIGQRLGFQIKYGLYKGKKNSIGFDGIWTSKDNYSYIIEVKTTDAYRINLDTIVEYKYKLIESKDIIQEKSSILIIVGREDTGDLEAQIRGSKHAWDIRLLSSDSLIRLLILKELLNDIRTIQQINEILKPNEYTKIDKLIELIFITSQDIQLVNNQESILDEENDLQKDNIMKHVQFSFSDNCFLKIQKHLNNLFKKESRTGYTDFDNKIGLINIISKKYTLNKNEKYWFGFQLHQKIFLQNYENAYIGFGCGSEELIFLIPFNELKPLLNNMNITEREDTMYWHVVILRINENYYVYQPLNKNNKKYDITKYKI